MTGHPCIWQELDPAHPRYSDILHAYRTYSDEAEHLKSYLSGIVDHLPRRDVFIDAGAGTGEYTALLADRFATTLAIEPDAALHAELRTTCPGAETLPVPILSAAPREPADFVLCSHVLYYVPEAKWPGHLSAMLSWLRAGGELAIVLQHPESGCMRIARHFGAPTRTLTSLLPHVKSATGRPYHGDVVRRPASLHMPDLATALDICQLVLGPLDTSSARTQVAAYLHAHAARPGGGFVLSCDQEILRVRSAS
ncbi:class I SAM-dependent methyltransferase [Streptomyces sp. Ac-502]|uniref:class I SAM-dependent methyltransferase n=1 Tax=Streptomyces sp. Ac-502 TaxID=3342801 RepID=UPI003862AEC2